MRMKKSYYAYEECKIVINFEREWIQCGFSGEERPRYVYYDEHTVKWKMVCRGEGQTIVPSLRCCFQDMFNE
jgi:hypothetical protein